jgi:hypothetical protein
MMRDRGEAGEIAVDAKLALSLLSSYLFFLSRRPISGSNAHYLAARLAGLQSLAGTLETSGSAELADVARRLRSIQPASFGALHYSLQFQLTVLQRAPVIPPEYIISASAPPAAFYAGVRRVLLILGPAIGIGDEIILFPLPQRLTAALSRASVVVMSGYSGLWDRTAGVERVIRYSAHSEILEALRGRHPAGPFDLIVFADFEKPGLTAPICSGAETGRYIELSLGAQCATAVDHEGRRVFATSMPLDAAINYYAAMDRLTGWLGFPGGPEDRYRDSMRREPRIHDSVFRIFVSPFTSKYEPSAVYWSQILASLFPAGPHSTVEFVLDPGTNLETERFSRSVARSAAARAQGGVQFRVARGAGSRILSLDEVFQELEQCDAAICADSFLAHAAPQFALTTLVVAKAGLENWRTPWERSYYLYLEQPLEETVAAMRVVLETTMRGPDLPSLAHTGQTHGGRLDAATRSLACALGDAPGAHGLNGHVAEFVESYAAMVEDLPRWPRECRGLWNDVAYKGEWVWRKEPPERKDAAAVIHLRDRVARWEQTNLRKFLRLICEPCVGQELAAAAAKDGAA